MTRFNPFAKAIAAGVVAAQAATVLAVIDGVISSTEWVLIAFAAATGFLAVWATSNSDIPAPEPTVTVIEEQLGPR